MTDMMLKKAGSTKVITIKLTKSGPGSGPFRITDIYGDVIDESVSKRDLIRGMSYTVESFVQLVVIESLGTCKIKQSFSLESLTIYQYMASTYTQSVTACLWRHLTNPEIYNFFYGNIEPYIIEYPFSYTYNDEILQNVKDYTKAYRYWKNGVGVFNYNDKVETDDRWFNKAIVYNGQQSSGVLELVPKPLHNLNSYGKYPIYNVDSKTITFTKSDNFYQYNTFWGLVKDKTQPLFTTSCQSLSIDKIVNQSNMDYGKRSFKKEPLRAKDLKVRHILDNRSDAHLVSQFITSGAMISYK